MKTIEFTLPYPPSANKLWTIARSARTRRALLIHSKDYAAWLKRCDLSCAYGKILPKLDAAKRYEVQIAFFPSKEGKVDVDNRNKPILDVLTRLGVWEDDSLVYKLSTIKGAPAQESFVYVKVSVYEDDVTTPEEFGGISKKYKRNRK